MDGKIFNSDGQYVANIRANGIYDLAGKKLYDLRGQKSTSQRANSWVFSTR